MFLVLLLLNAAGGDDRIVEEQVDLVEVNHFYDPGTGQLVFDQVIWYRWNDLKQRMDVIAWRLLSDCRESDEEDMRKWNAENNHGLAYVGRWVPKHAAPFTMNGKYVSFWYDSKTTQYRKIVAKTRRDSWTTFDVELKERENLPQELRTGLKNGLLQAWQR